MASAALPLALLASAAAPALGLLLGDHQRDRAFSTRNEAYTLQLTSFHNVQYTAPVTIGGQTLPVIYDTGSFEVIVMSSLCDSCVDDYPVYAQERSHTFHGGANTTMEHVFGSGPVRSRKGYETVQVGGADSPYVASNLSFWRVIDHKIDVWQGGGASFVGIVGLGHGDYAPQAIGEVGPKDATLLNATNVNRFAICLERSAMAAPGRLVLGAQLPVGVEYHTLQVKGQIHWAVQMTSFRVQNFGQVLCQSPSCGVIVDSGTSLITVPPDANGMVDYLTDLVKTDCSNVHALPWLQFNLNGVPIELPPAAYVVKVRELGWSDFVPIINSSSTYYCQVAFMKMDKMSQMGPVVILGMPFLRYFYTIFDRQANQIHLARAGVNCNLMPWTHTGHQTMNAIRGAAPESAPAASHSLSAWDYEPVPVDMKAARVPQWAMSGGKHLDI